MGRSRGWKAGGAMAPYLNVKKNKEKFLAVTKK